MKKQTEVRLKKQGVTSRFLPLVSIEFQAQIKDFKQWLRVFGFADSTVSSAPVFIRSFFFFLERSKILTIEMITNYHIKHFIGYLSDRISELTNKKLSQNYILNHLNALKLFSRYLMESKGIIMDSSLRFSRGLTYTRKWLQKSEIEQLFETCKTGKAGDINRVILALYYGLGLRRMEGVGLDVSDIQWSSGIIYVKHAKFKHERYVPMNQKVQKCLEIYNVRYRIPVLKKFGNMSESALLVSEIGGRITGNAVYSRLQNLARKAGLSIPLSLHTLRHSIATHLLENGLAMENISLFLGHKSLESTQIYTHLIHKNN